MGNLNNYILSQDSNKNFSVDRIVVVDGKKLRSFIKPLLKGFKRYKKKSSLKLSNGDIVEYDDKDKAMPVDIYKRVSFESENNSYTYKAFNDYDNDPSYKEPVVLYSEYIIEHRFVNLINLLLSIFENIDLKKRCSDDDVCLKELIDAGVFKNEGFNSALAKILANRKDGVSSEYIMLMNFFSLGLLTLENVGNLSCKDVVKSGLLKRISLSELRQIVNNSRFVADVRNVTENCTNNKRK